MRNNPTVQGWLINLPLNVKQITQELIEIAIKNMPGAVVGWRRERLRHVKIWSVDEAKNPALAKLITATWSEAPKSIAKVLAGRKKSKA